MRQNLRGRRRTSLEGGNRGMRSGESGSVTVYGDLKGGFVANLANEPICKMMKLLICFRLMPMWPIFRCLRG